MSDILFLVHRLPFPPNKGDKIRSFHILEYLASRFPVHLGCFLDDPADRQHVEELRKYCESLFVCELDRRRATARSMTGLLSGKALTLPFYRDRRFAAWVDARLREGKVSTVLTFSSSMGQYVLGQRYSRVRRVMDFVDLDSDKWRQYARRTSVPKRWVYAREARKLARFENRVADEFDAVVFVSNNETATFGHQHPASRDRQFTIANGVATDYFDPSKDYPCPFDNDALPIVFTGMMDYWPNVDAVSWFAGSILPSVRELVPNAQFWIVGAAPTRDVQALAELPGVQVTGPVPDVRPYLRHAAVVVAPVRIARGIQNKVLEAMAMDKPVVSAPQAVQGLDDRLPAAPLALAATAAEFAERVIAALAPGAGANGPRPSPRRYVVEHFSWRSNLEKLDALLDIESARPRRGIPADREPALRRAGSP